MWLCYYNVAGSMGFFAFLVTFYMLAFLTKCNFSVLPEALTIVRCVEYVILVKSYSL